MRLRSFFHLFIWTISIFLLAPSFALAQDWPTDYQNQDRNAVIEGSSDLELEKVRKIEPTLGSFELPVYSDGIFYISEKQVKLNDNKYSVSAVTKKGEQIWQINRDEMLGSSPVVFEDKIIIPGAKLIIANKKTGEIIGSPIESYRNDFHFSFPVVFGGYIYVWNTAYTNAGVVLKINISTGIKEPGFIGDFNSKQTFPITPFGGDIYITCNNNANNTEVRRYHTDGTLVWEYESRGAPSGPAVTNGNSIFISGLTGEFVEIDLTIGKIKRKFDREANATVPVILEDHAYFLSISAYETAKGGKSYLYALDLGSWEYDLLEEFDSFQIRADITPFAIGSDIYFTLPTGEIAQYNYIENDLELFEIGLDYPNMTRLMAGDGELAILSSDKKALYFSSFYSYYRIDESEVVLESPYICLDCNAYLGQVHAHFVEDLKFMPDRDPAHVVKRYRDAGYDFIAMTEHNAFTVDPGIEGITFIGPSEEDTQGAGGNHILALDIDFLVDEGASDQERIDSVFGQGGFSSLAHPNQYDYRWNLSELLEADNYNAVEVYNTAISTIASKWDLLRWLIQGELIWDDGIALDKWDQLLSRGKRVWATAGDDSTPWNPGDFDGASVVVFASGNSQAEIMNGLKSGNYYSKKGSDASDLKIQTIGKTIKVDLESENIIKFISKNGKVLKEVTSESASYDVFGTEGYVRISIGSGQGQAWSQPIYISVRSDQIIPGGGRKKIDFKGGSVVADTSSGLGVKTASRSKRPDDLPGLGYLSEAYELSGELAGQSQVSLDFEDQTENIEQNLAVYSYDKSKSKWVRLDSAVDSVNNKAVASLSELSFVALGYDFLEDNATPNVSLVAPLNLSGLSGPTLISVLANDKESEISYVSVYLDGVKLFTDIESSDGYGREIDFGDYPSGEHTLTIFAEDLFGNISQEEYVITITDGISVPGISINDVSNTDTLVITGNFESENKPDFIAIYHGENYLGNAVIDEDGGFAFTHEEVGGGNIIVILGDDHGNIAFSEFKVVEPNKEEPINQDSETGESSIDESEETSILATSEEIKRGDSKKNLSFLDIAVGKEQVSSGNIVPEDTEDKQDEDRLFTLSAVNSNANKTDDKEDVASWPGSDTQNKIIEPSGSVKGSRSVEVEKKDKEKLKQYCALMFWGFLVAAMILALLVKRKSNIGNVGVKNKNNKHERAG